VTPATWRLDTGEALELLARLPSDSVDGVITDPPYSSGGQFRGDRAQSTVSKYVHSGQQSTPDRPEFSGDTRDQRGYHFWCALWLSECLRIAKPGAPIAVFTDWRQLPTTSDVLQAGGWLWRGVVPWSKTQGARPQMGRFRAQCEYVVWGSKGPLPQRTDVGTLPGFFEISVTNEGAREHIAAKPIAIMEEIARIVPPGGVILDPFAGSGSTALGALKCGRSFIGFELDPAIAERARQRIGGPLFAPAPDRPE
jgi:site-specific DNA-methyltransferase (adenine-specific)